MMLLIIFNFRQMGFYGHQDRPQHFLGMQEKELIYHKIHVDVICL